MAEKPTTLRVALAKAWPGLRYLSFGVWAAWLYLISSGSIWLSDNEFDGTYVAQLMLGLSTISALICLSAPLIKHRFIALLSNRSVVMASSFVATLGAIIIIAAGPYYFANPFLFIPGIVLASLFSGFFVLKCGSLFGTLDSRLVLQFALYSEILVVILSYFVVGNDFFVPIAGGPSLSSILAFALLPPIAAWLVCLPAGNDAGSLSQGASSDKQSQAEDKKGAGDFESLKNEVSLEESAAAPILESPRAPQVNSKPELLRLPRDFWKFMFMIFFVTLASEMFRDYFVAVRIPTITFIDSRVVLLLRLAFTIIILFYALRTSKQIRFARIFQFALVALAIVVAMTPFFQDYITLFGSLLGVISVCINLTIWCLLSMMVYEKKMSFITVFGFGQGSLFAAKAIGWVFGMWILPTMAGTSLEIFFYWGIAILILLATILFFSEMHLERLFENIAKGTVSLDMSEQDALAKKERRPWLEACKRIGERALLSKREQEIFELIATGRSPKNIAKHFVVSINTVRSHIRNIYVKLDAHSHEDLVELVERELDSAE